MISKDRLGRVVYSKKGRDQEKIFIVIKVINDQYVIVADGDFRRIENPKLKNIRHLQFTNIVDHELVEMLSKDEVPANHVIRKSIKGMLETQHSTGEGGLVNG